VRTILDFFILLAHCDFCRELGPIVIFFSSVYVVPSKSSRDSMSETGEDPSNEDEEDEDENEDEEA